MIESRKSNSGNGISFGAALGVLFVMVYRDLNENMSFSIAIGLAVGAALVAIFDFIENRNLINNQTKNLSSNKKCFIIMGLSKSVD